MRFESILNQKKNYSKLEIIKEELQYYWSKLQDFLFYKPLYWFKVRFISKHRYHILDLTKGGNGYRHGWYDTDSRMLQACFLLLIEYVEKENPFEMIDWNVDERHKEIAAEIKYLYNWWKTDRAAKHAALAKEWESLPPEEATRFVAVEDGGFKIQIPDSHKVLNVKTDELDEEDNRNLQRLIKIRGFLWT